MMKLSISRDTVLRRIKPAEESGEIEVEGSKGKHPKTFRPGVKQSHIGLPTVRELAEAFPDLAQNFNAVNPITGKTVTREELINPSSRRAKTEEENAQKVENIETPKPRKVWRCKNGHDSFTSTCPICGEQAYVVPPPGFGRWLGETEAKLFTLERRERDRGDRSMGKM